MLYDEVYVEDRFVTSYGQHGRCRKCRRAKSTFESDDLICVTCRKEDGNFYLFSTRSSDAKFSCPGSSSNENCGANNLSFDEFFLGVCCETASKWTDTVNTHNDKVKKMQGLYNQREISVQREKYKIKECHRYVTKQEKMLEEAKKELARAQKGVEDQKASLENANKALTESIKKLAQAEEISKKHKARMMIFVVEMVKAEGKSVVEKEREKNSCIVCFENYSLPDRQECALPCGHRSCYKCLAELQQKNCQTCRQSFYVGQIYKLF